ncbi:MAG: tetratricopeptide repeat protein [Opitutaceae bacterium]|nr:tetratricopeptide repeat protein [Opitutaceae bacterium]
MAGAGDRPLPRAVRSRPDFAEAHYNLANELARTEAGRDEAIAHYRAALRAKPDLAVAHNNLAQLFYQAGALDNAIRELEAALRVNPRYEDARVNLESLRALKKSR